MALSVHGVRLSQTSPAFLHANSTSHTWIFSAIAELVDNAYDPDVSAANLAIATKEVNGKICVTFTDDGNGCPPEKLHKMLSFGYCEKIEIKGHRPIGHYGNGFKSGSMRLGKDAIVFTKHGRYMSVGFLSQTFLETISAESVLVPIVTWDKRTYKVQEAPDAQGSLDAILKHSLFNSEEDLFQEFNAIDRGSGMRILIYNLKRGSDGHLELDVESDRYDIINSEHHELDFAGGLMSRPIRDHMPEYRRSLREYLSILFLKPKMKISLNGKRVKTKLIRKSLRKTRKTSYKPSYMLSQGKKGVDIIFGFGPSKQDYGVMMYYKNRLIKAYERVGAQKQANEIGVGVVGVVELDFLEPIHNKQDFSKTDQYNAALNALGVKIGQYWNSVTGNSDMAMEYLARPDWTWVQCDKCLKWRRMPDEFADRDLPEKWYCYQNPDMSHNRCDIDEEPEDEDDVFRLVINKNKQTKSKEVRPPPMIQNTFGVSADGMHITQRTPPSSMTYTSNGPRVIRPGIPNRGGPTPSPSPGPRPPLSTPRLTIPSLGRGRVPATPPRSIFPTPSPSPTTTPSKTQAPGTSENEIKEEDEPQAGSSSASGKSGSASSLKVAMFSKGTLNSKKRAAPAEAESETSEDGPARSPSKRTKKTPKKYTEITNDAGDMVVVLTSSEDESEEEEGEEGRPQRPASTEEDKPNVDELNEQIASGTATDKTPAEKDEPMDDSPASAAKPATSGEGKQSQASKGSDTEKEELRKQLEATNKKLSTLRSNINRLLQILVPNLSLNSPEMVDEVVVEMINVNAQQGRGNNNNDVDTTSQNGLNEASAVSSTTNTPNIAPVTTPVKVSLSQENSVENVKTPPKTTAVVNGPQKASNGKPDTLVNGASTSSSPVETTSRNDADSATNKASKPVSEEPAKEDSVPADSKEGLVKIQNSLTIKVTGFEGTTEVIDLDDDDDDEIL